MENKNTQCFILPKSYHSIVKQIIVDKLAKIIKISRLYNLEIIGMLEAGVHATKQKTEGKMQIQMGTIGAILFFCALVLNIIGITKKASLRQIQDTFYADLYAERKKEIAKIFFLEIVLVVIGFCLIAAHIWLRFV